MEKRKEGGKGHRRPQSGSDVGRKMHKQTKWERVLASKTSKEESSSVTTI